VPSSLIVLDLNSKRRSSTSSMVQSDRPTQQAAHLEPHKSSVSLPSPQPLLASKSSVKLYEPPAFDNEAFVPAASAAAVMAVASK